MNYYLMTITFIWLMVSCTDEPVETIFFDLDTRKGVFIACEGNFMYGNSSLSFYNTESQKVNNQIFYARNNAPLGDVAQSLAIKDDQLYIVMNNSGRIYVADARTLEYRGSITGLTSPRYIHFVSDDKAYISDLYAHHITIFNPKNLQITGSIDLGEHTSEQMVQVGKYVYVSDWVAGDAILEIDVETDALTGTIEAVAHPKNLEVDKHGKIWVLAGGSYRHIPLENSSSALLRIDPQTRTVEQIYRFKGEVFASSLDMNQTGDTLFYVNRDLFKMAVTSRDLPDKAFIAAGDRLFYHLDSDPIRQDLYVADAIDYTQNAIVYRFRQDGTVLDSFSVGINPSCFLFIE